MLKYGGRKIKERKNLLLLDRVLYARKGGEDVESGKKELGGDKIDVEEAIVSDEEKYFSWTWPSKYIFRN